jgi:DNA-binding response OmpR family regulator
VTDQPARILVVDDEPAIRFTLQRVLERSGYVVTIAADGAEAENVLQRDAFDLIVADIRMPGISGLELARRARDIQPAAAVLLLTANQPLRGEDDSVIEGFDCLYKSAGPKEIIARVAEKLASR